ncbi:MAG: FAD-binding oxidoreductase [Solirubrobacteraceae bacterium]
MGPGRPTPPPPRRPHEPAPDMAWWAWGDPAQAAPLSERMLALVRGGLGAGDPAAHVFTHQIEDLRLPAPRLPAAAEQRLSELVGSENVRADRVARILHTRGKSTPDLLRLRSGEADDAPDAVVLPGGHEEVLEVLRCCAAHTIAVMPFGGGTSVVGGLQPRRERFAGVIALDLRRMNALLALDEISRTATFEPGLRGPQAEALLARHGYTIGHFPQSFLYATIGGFAATRSSGQASAGYGRFDENVVALRIATPQGTIELGQAPRSAAGPDLRQLFLGSEGALGVITAVTVELRPAPPVTLYEAWRLPSFAQGCETIRQLVQDGPLPTVIRLSDEIETALSLERPADSTQRAGGGGETAAGGPSADPAAPAAQPASGGCMTIVGYEGTGEDVSARRAAISAVLAASGALPQRVAGEGWEQGRYLGPYLRDALLDAGAIVETLETATFWSGLPRLYAAVRDALGSSLRDQGSPAVVMCHLSHVYRTGASLYFTVACAQLEDPLAQWWQAKAAACDAIVAAGGTITHHHGVGVDHRPWYERQIGPLALGALRAVKRELDPAGILNPGVLIS